MGVEYSLRFECRDPATLAELLRRIDGSREDATTLNRFEFRNATNAGIMPDAEASPEPGGLYFCDYGGSGCQLLGHLVARVVSVFGPVTISERE